MKSKHRFRNAVQGNLLAFNIALGAAIFAAAPFVTPKRTEILGVSFTVGLIFITLMYSLMDVVNEVWGRDKARAMAATVVVCRMFVMTILVPLALFVPTASAPDGFTEVIHFTWRAYLAGEITVFITSILIDVPVFAWLKKKKIPGGFFARTNLSNVASQLFATASFVLLAFYGTEGPSVIDLFWGQLVAKTVMTLAFSVVLIPWVRWLKKTEALEEVRS